MDSRLHTKLPKVQFKRKSGPKEWVLFDLSIVCAVLSAWFGYRLIIFGESLSSTELFVIGVASVVIGIIIAANDYHWSIGFLVILFGFYNFARSAGLIKFPILSFFLAAACLFAGALLMYITYPDRNNQSS